MTLEFRVPHDVDTDASPAPSARADTARAATRAPVCAACSTAWPSVARSPAIVVRSPTCTSSTTCNAC